MDQEKYWSQNSTVLLLLTQLVTRKTLCQSVANLYTYVTLFQIVEEDSLLNFVECLSEVSVDNINPMALLKFRHNSIPI